MELVYVIHSEKAILFGALRVETRCHGDGQECSSYGGGESRNDIAYFLRLFAMASNNPSHVASLAVIATGSPASLAAAAVMGLMAAMWRV